MVITSLHLVHDHDDLGPIRPEPVHHSNAHCYSGTLVPPEKKGKAKAIKPFFFSGPPTKAVSWLSLEQGPTTERHKVNWLRGPIRRGGGPKECCLLYN